MQMTDGYVLKKQSSNGGSENPVLAPLPEPEPAIRSALSARMLRTAEEFPPR